MSLNRSPKATHQEQPIEKLKSPDPTVEPKDIKEIESNMLEALKSPKAQPSPISPPKIIKKIDASKLAEEQKETKKFFQQNIMHLLNKQKAEGQKSSPEKIISAPQVPTILIHESPQSNTVGDAQSSMDVEQPGEAGAVEVAAPIVEPATKTKSPSKKVFEVKSILKSPSKKAEEENQQKETQQLQQKNPASQLVEQKKADVESKVLSPIPIPHRSIPAKKSRGFWNCCGSDSVEAVSVPKAGPRR